MPPNSAVLSCFYEAKIRNSCIVILLDQLKDDDLLPLIDLFKAMKSCNIDPVNIIHESTCNLNEENLMSLLRAVDVKLRVLDLSDMSLKDNFLWDLCQNGLACEVLNLRSTNIRKLNMAGKFTRLKTLNLDFCTSLTSFHYDCFSCMPNLTSVSMCETRVADLWTTTAALSKLPSLVELRFQNRLCCTDTRPCPKFPQKDTSISVKSNTGLTPFWLASTGYGGMHLDSFSANKLDNESIGILKLSSNMNKETELKNEVEDSKNNVVVLQNYSSHHPSPICYEKHYRDYLIASLPNLEVLDNFPVTNSERKKVKITVSKYFECSPYNRPYKEKILGILQNREVGGAGPYGPNFSNSTRFYRHGKSRVSFQRSLSAARLGSWPQLQPLSSFSKIDKEGSKRLRPRQFEYHPSNSRLMVFGTLDGEIVVINNENGKVVGYVPSNGAMNSILGLCWLKNHPSKLLAGSDNGCLKLFDIDLMPPKVADTKCNSGVVNFDDFEPLTSVHVNATDDQFLASGCSKDVALYDINTRRRIQLFANMHREPINVAKFAHHSPFLFATSSFDRETKLWDLRQNPEQPCYTVSSSRGNVMVCFSPDDKYLLVSAIDNEVKQLLAVDGRVYVKFEIESTGSAHNYTRSYYINGRDYVISGSCDESVVHVCCAQTGRRLRDVHLEDTESGNSLFVQSLRGDPYRPFHMSVLAALKRPISKSEIIKVNLLASDYSTEEWAM